MSLYYVPTTPAEVTEDWISQTLKTSLTSKGHDVSEVKVTYFKASKPAEFGMLSSVFQAVCEAQSPDGSKSEHKLFIKIMPQDKEHKDLFDATAMDVTEVECYNSLFADLIEFEKEKLGEGANFSAYLPKCVASGYVNEVGKTRAFFLMMEDLSPKFKMESIDKGERVS